MTRITWKDSYNINYKEIDRQHQGLVDLLNRLDGLAGVQPQPERLAGIFSGLCQYAVQHFRTEEGYLRASGYPDLARHESEHAWFVQRLLELDRTFDPADPRLVGTTQAFLLDWLMRHIQESDQAFAGHLRGFRQRAAIRGVIFDFGRVIMDFEPGALAQRVAEACGKPAAQLEPLFDGRSPLFQRYESGRLDTPGFLAEVSRICGRSFTEAEFLPLFTGYFRPIKSTQDLIRRLKPNYRLGLLSNTNPLHWEHVIQPCPVLPRFDAVTLSFQAGTMKPDPALFQDCLDKLGLAAEECVFIDDVPEFAQAADANLMHGIVYQGYLDLLRRLRELGVEYWR
jgi:putative hydrolase of the HAD superfamily